MHKQNFNKLMALSVMLTIVFSMSGMVARAQQKYQFSGKQTVAITKQERSNVADMESHILSLSEWNGVNESLGNTEFMDGAQVFAFLTADLVHFSGYFQGYSIMTKKGESTFSKFEGKLTTTLSSDGTPVSTMEGTFSFLKGTGQYENIRGGGAIMGRYIASNIVVWDVEAEYWIEK
jgi:hypothetical protein